MIKQKSKIHYHYLARAMNIGSNHRLEEGRIIDAYFGKLPELSQGESPSTLGLHLYIRWQSFSAVGDALASYTNMRGIEKIMDDFQVIRTEELKGREVTVHLDGDCRLLGISIPKNE